MFGDCLISCFHAHLPGLQRWDFFFLCSQGDGKKNHHLHRIITVDDALSLQFMRQDALLAGSIMCMQGLALH